MRRAGLAIGVMCVLLGAVILTYSASPVLPQAPLTPQQLTVTYNAAFATHASTVLGTPVHPFLMSNTVTALAPNRTAIALTRDPLLAMSPTPNPVHLTLTRLVVESYEGLDTTATHIVAMATGTQAAQLGTVAPTFTAGPPMLPSPCHAWTGSTYEADLSSQIQTALTDAGIQNTFVTINASGVFQPAGCGTPFSPLGVQFSILVETDQIKILADHRAFADFITAILEVLTTFPLQEVYSTVPARLIITFELTVYRRTIHTDYTNALAAYEEGLRGEALLEALGGILPA
jgi:hypothetical protein